MLPAPVMGLVGKKTPLAVALSGERREARHKSVIPRWTGLPLWEQGSRIVCQRFLQQILGVVATERGPLALAVDTYKKWRKVC